MSFHQLSFTKNLGGLKNVHRSLIKGYVPGITLKEFTSAVRSILNVRAVLISEFFVATRLIGRVEYVVEDALVRQAFFQPANTVHARLSLFALMLNQPGERATEQYRAPAAAQNEYVRTELHDGKGWLASKLDLGSLKPWVKANVMEAGGGTKFATNFRALFDQCRFPLLATGHLKTYANHWGPLALRLFFDRHQIAHPNATVDDLVEAARNQEVHKLLGVPVAWLEQCIAGAAIAYVNKRPDLLFSTIEEAEEDEELSHGPAGKRTPQIGRMIQLSESNGAAETLYSRTCLVCGSDLKRRRP